MVTTINFKDTIDLPKWKFASLSPIGGSSINRCSCCDFRNNIDKNPLNYDAQTTGSFASYNTKNDGWSSITGFALASSVTAMFFMSSYGPRGTIAAGATTTTFTLTTALPTTIGPNQLANRGDGIGFKIRVIGNSAGSSGKIEERIIISNTGPTTTPTLELDSALSFTPANGDVYEFLSGRIYILGATNAVGSWKYYDVLTNSFSGNLATTNLPASWLPVNIIGTDELLVPYDRNPGEGFYGNLIATASGATSLTGQAALGDASVLINEYRNFQIRIVQDIAIPTAVGQRRNITSHTAGPSSIYTVPVWTVTPSATATYVIESNSDRILMWSNANTATTTYTIAGNAWDTNVTFGARAGAIADGASSIQAYSIEPDTFRNVRHSFIYSFRGGGGTLDILDIAGAATGVWSSTVVFGGSGPTFNTDTYTHDPATNQGRYMYIMSYNNCYRFDMKNRVLEPYSKIRNPIGTTSRASTTMSYALFIDGSTKISTIINSTVSGSFGNTFPTLTFALTILR